jgi:DNA helicase II / ATP-dependent DNA helicase PcrA
LIGWDFDLIGAIAQLEKGTLICVGDFRQTIYKTSNAQKKPKTNIEKLGAFNKIGFETEYMNISWRCIQKICDFADMIHANDNYYQPTSSQVTQVPGNINKHQGIFVVSTDSVSEYLARYNPVILRLNRKTNTQLCDGHKTFNFGEVKGLGFDHVLILPTKKHMDFLSGKTEIFNSDKTDEAKNKFYVAITRARYSVAFLSDDNVALESVQPWIPSS